MEAEEQGGGPDWKLGGSHESITPGLSRFTAFPEAPVRLPLMAVRTPARAWRAQRDSDAIRIQTESNEFPATSEEFPPLVQEYG